MSGPEPSHIHVRTVDHPAPPLPPEWSTAIARLTELFRDLPSDMAHLDEHEDPEGCELCRQTAELLEWADDGLRRMVRS